MRAKRSPRSVKKSADAPLVVDLDGTLIFTDILIESAFALLGRNPFLIFAMLGVLFSKGKAGLKAYLADRADIDVTLLPFDEEVISIIRQAREDGRSVYLASASHEKYVGAIADHLGLFDGWCATNDETNLAGSKKRDLLVKEFGANAFDYIGNDAVDLKIWAESRKSISVNAPRRVEARLKKSSQDVEIIKTRPP